MHNHTAHGDPAPSYFPLLLIILYILVVTILNNLSFNSFNWQGWMNQFMAGFFLTFSAFKLINLPAFAEGYATYDLLAKKWHVYGYIYPFLELTLGILYLTQIYPKITNICTIIIMGFSSIGVFNSLLQGQKLRCACLGTVLNVPLSSITLVEDISMVVLAIIALV